MIRAAFFDFDNTLYSHKNSRIPESTKEAIRLLCKNNIYPVLCTGRCVEEFTEFNLNDLGFFAYITVNGQIIRDKNYDIIYDIPITGELKESILKQYNKKEFSMYLYNKGDLFCNYLSEDLKRIHKEINSPVPFVKEYEGEDIYMASCICETKEQIEFIKSFSNLAELTNWYPDCIDLNPKGISKASAIDVFLDKYNIGLDQTIAFGDAGNDLEMLKHCHISVAMGNAWREIKEVCDYVTNDIDEDGIYNALKHYELI